MQRRPQRFDQALDLAHRLLEVVVHHDGVELGRPGLLGVGLGQAPLEVVGVGLGVPIQQPGPLDLP